MKTVRGSWCNGYIKVAESPDEVEIKRSEKGIEGMDVTYDRFLGEIQADELTYSGTLHTLEESPEGYYLGFDSNHLWNRENPHSQEPDAVKERTKEMVAEFEEADVFSRVKSDSDNESDE